MWQWVINHKQDSLLGVIFAVAFSVFLAVVMDEVRGGSLFRERIRRAKNEKAASSYPQIPARINELKWQREGLVSGRGLYLGIFRALFLFLMTLTAAGLSEFIVVMASLRGFPLSKPFVYSPLALFFVALGAGCIGLRECSLDHREYAERTTRQIKEEIEDLQKRLAEIA